jgi:hypothetical protein
MKGWRGSDNRMAIHIVPFVPLKKQMPEQVLIEPLSFEPWNKTGTPSCQAGFSISHFEHGITLHFATVEPFLQAKKRKSNGQVHRDNCVEFFISFGKSDAYYNFEFNCLGSVKAAYGPDRHHRRYLPKKIVKRIANDLSLSIRSLEAVQGIAWDITITLPLQAFCFSKLTALTGLESRANFVKCGDSLPKPHFVSWSNIDTPEPDFHQPSFFGKLLFQPASLNDCECIDRNLNLKDDVPFKQRGKQEPDEENKKNCA